MTDNVNSIGVSMDDPGFNDDDDQDSGALSAALPGTSSGNTQSSARKNAFSRFDENESEMQDFRKQYADTSKAQSDAYAQQKAQLDAATKRLMDMQVGPSDQEAQLRAASAILSHKGNGVGTGEMYGAQADILQQRREAEMQKQQLLAQYGMQGPQATIGATNAKLNQLTQQERIAQSGLNSSGGQMYRGQANVPFGFIQNQDGSVSVAPGMSDAWATQAAAKLYGKVTLVPQPDGSKKIVPLGGINKPPGASQPTPQTPTQPVASANAPVSARPPAAAAPVNGSALAPPAASTSPYDDLFLPSTVLDPKYGALTPQTKPAYVATAQQAFDPQYFGQYQWHPTVIGDDKIRAKQIEKTSDAMADSAAGAESTIYNYGNALHAMDQVPDDKLRSGPTGQRISAWENTLRGLLPDSVVDQVFNDADMKKLATQQDTDKYFLNAATTGLKAIYGGKITNMEVQQRLKSLPSNNLLPAVARMLASAQAEVAQDTINRAKVYGAYIQRNGNPNPATFNTWYEANFSPFHESRLKSNLAAKPAAANPAAANPMDAYNQALVAYYSPGGGFSKGLPKPVKPNVQP